MTCGPTRPSERLYADLKQDVIAQAFGLGGRLPVHDLAARYDVSITPVREALSRLHGEDLIGFTCGQGYFCLATSLADLQDQISLQELLLTRALRYGAPELRAVKRQTAVWTGATILQLWERIVSGSGLALRILQHIHCRTSFVLERALSEPEPAHALGEALGQLEEALSRRDAAGQCQALTVYHARLMQSLPDMLGGYVHDQYLAAR